MYICLSKADLIVKAHFYAAGEVFGQIERSSPLYLQLSFLTARFQSDNQHRLYNHRPGMEAWK